MSLFFLVTEGCFFLWIFFKQFCLLAYYIHKHCRLLTRWYNSAFVAYFMLICMYIMVVALLSMFNYLFSLIFLRFEFTKQPTEQYRSKCNCVPGKSAPCIPAVSNGTKFSDTAATVGTKSGFTTASTTAGPNQCAC